MTIDEDLAATAGEMDARFESSQSRLVALMRAHGVTDGEMPAVLAAAHTLYWRERERVLTRLRSVLEQVAGAAALHPVTERTHTRNDDAAGGGGAAPGMAGRPRRRGVTGRRRLYLRDLNPIRDFGKMTPETIAHAVLSLRDELRQILIARRVVH